MKLGEIAQIAQGTMWLTPRYENFIVNQRNYATERAALMRILDRPERVRSNTWSASGAGKCLRQRQFSYLGRKEGPIDPKSANIFANGDYVHLRHQVAGIVGGYLRHVEYPVSVPGLNLTGTLDGVTIEGHGAEFKSINSRGFSQIMSYGVKPEHRYQMHSYMLAADISLFYVVYENKDTNEMREFRVDRDEVLIHQIEEDLHTLNEATADGVLLPMLDECVARTGRFNRCPFKEICPTAQFAPSESRPRIRVVRSTRSA